MRLTDKQFYILRKNHEKLWKIGYKCRLMLMPREYRVETPDGEKFVFTDFAVYESWVVGVLDVFQEAAQN